MSKRSNPKYSLVIPTLNGYEGLSVTLPYILNLPRMDFEVIVSDNCSDDGTLSFLRSINDPRLVVVSPTNRMPHSEHLNFAYKYASGEWVNHIGDDDLVFSNRFERMDELTRMAEINDCDIIIGKSIRYIWPGNNYEHPNTINTDYLFGFTSRVSIVSGKSAFVQSINQLSISGGGESLYRGALIRQIIDKFGYFCPPDPYVEFFGLRMCYHFARNVMEIDIPLYINGRMSKSIGNSLLAKKSSFDWKFENPRGSWRFCPLDTYAYCTISLDAALAVESLLGTRNFDKFYWGTVCSQYALSAARGTSIDNTLTPRARLLYQCFRHYPVGTFFGLVKKLTEKVTFIVFGKVKATLFWLFIEEHTMFRSLSERLVPAEIFGVRSIVELADWYPKTRSNVTQLSEPREAWTDDEL